MDMRQQIKFFANMFNTDYNYARQCFKDMSEFIQAAIECGETVHFQGCFNIGLKRTNEIQRYNFKKRELETVPASYKLYAKFLPKLEKAAKKDSALKRFTVEQEANKK